MLLLFLMEMIAGKWLFISNSITYEHIFLLNVWSVHVLALLMIHECLLI